MRETGKNMPDVSILVEISNYFGVSILELIEGERKQDIMVMDNKENLKTIANYADEQKRIILKNIHRSDLICLILCIISIISIPKFEETRYVGWLMAGYLPLGVICGILISNMSSSAGLDGIIKSYKQKYRVLKYLEIILLIVLMFIVCRDMYSIFLSYKDIIL